MPTLISWPTDTAPADFARQAAELLQSGQYIVVPSEIGPVLLAHAEALIDPGRPHNCPLDWTCFRYDGYFDSAELFERDPSRTPEERFMIQRLVPGAIAIARDGGFPAWLPNHLAVATILMGTSPLAILEIQGEGPIEWERLGDRLAWIVQEREQRTGTLTVVRVVDRHWSIARSGSVTEGEIRLMLNRRIVFVCTGNTCRSPMAEAIFKMRLAQRLNCNVAELPDRGYLISSAGVAAGAGDRPSPEAVEAVDQMGADLSQHRSQPAGVDLIAKADDIICMTRSHLMTLVSRYPVLAGSMRLLRGGDGDLDDPIGSGVETYRACATMILQHVDRLILEMGL